MRTPITIYAFRPLTGTLPRIRQWYSGAVVILNPIVHRAYTLSKPYIGYIAGTIVLLTIFVLIRSVSWALINKGTSVPEMSDEKITAAQAALNLDISRLNRQLDSRLPRSWYLVINSSSNEFTLFNGKELIKRDKCSTGSYILLKNGEDQQWMFKTPKGEFRILGKTTAPVWKKPDWAFVEEGLPVPPANHYSRFEYGVMGDYALNLGQGYLIHGTLYQRFLGLPVTHGCIRLNDENLELIYRSLPVGSKVYIY